MPELELVVNPASIRPRWPLSVSVGANGVDRFFDDAQAFAWDIEDVNTLDPLDEDIRVTDAEDRPITAIIGEPGWTWLLHRASGERRYLSYVWSDTEHLTVEMVGRDCVRAMTWSTEHRPGSVTRTWPQEIDDESRVSVPASGPVSPAVGWELFEAAWCSGHRAAHGRRTRRKGWTLRRSGT